MAKYIKGKEKFVNPYNFISIGGPISKTDITDMKPEDLVSGELVCRVTVKTPLAIPGGVEKQEEQREHNVYKAFRYKDGGNVVIPGSSIRGMIRSEYETITNSCFRTMDGNDYLTSRADVTVNTKNRAFKPALLIKENNEWNIYEANRIPVVVKGEKYKKIDNENGIPFVKFEYGYEIQGDKKIKYIKNETGDKFYYGDKVRFENNGPGHNKKICDKNTNKEKFYPVWKNSVNKLYKADNETGKIGYMYVGEPIRNKHAESVFEKGMQIDADEKEILNAMHALEFVINTYRDNAINRNLGDKEQHYGYQGYEHAKKNNAIPVWYNQEVYNNDKHIILSIASIGRFSYYRNMAEISSEHMGCSSRKCLCPACTLFGMIGKDGQSKVGNLRFTDALLCKDKGTTKNVLLKELGAPRPSYLHFYSKGGKSYNEKDALIRGRKYYWHIPKAAEKADIYTDKTATNRNITMELINTGNEFQFSVYYDSITEEQLRVLKYVLSLKDDRHMHKLGHGKPLGLGSVQIQVLDDRRKVHDLNMENYCINKQRVDNNLIEDIKFIDSKALEQFNIITNFDEITNMEVRYPFVSIIEKYSKEKLKENILASHQWFSNNIEELPDITVPNMYKTFNQFEVYEITDKDKVKKIDNNNGYWDNNRSSNRDNNRGNNYASRAKNNNRH